MVKLKRRKVSVECRLVTLVTEHVVKCISIVHNAINGHSRTVNENVVCQL